LIDTDGEITGLPSIPSPVAGNGATGLGDINYSLFVSPAVPKGAIWGIGPSITMPSASDDELGSEKWSTGPTGVVLFQPKWGTIGGLVRHLWSFAGDSDRDDVNQTLFEPFVNYNLSEGWYLIADIVITANWEASSSNTWTVPLGGGVGKLLNSFWSFRTFGWFRWFCSLGSSRLNKLRSSLREFNWINLDGLYLVE